MNKNQKKRLLFVSFSIILAVVLITKIDRSININCIGKTREEVLKLLDDYSICEVSGKKRIKIKNSGYGWHFDNIYQIKLNLDVMSLSEWEIFESDLHFSIFAGWKYLVVKFNSEGIVIDQEVRCYFDGP